MRQQTESALDQAFSAFMAARCGLCGTDRESFAAVIRQLTAALRVGHICITLDSGQLRLLEGSRLVSTQAELPLVLSGSRLYLARYYHYETRLADQLRELALMTQPVQGGEELLERCFAPVNAGVDWQRQAASLALASGLCIITGGPGTGKTSTVVKIAALLLALKRESKLAFAAPTGKAAMRLRESVARQLDQLPFNEDIVGRIPRQTSTLHRLLGSRRFSPAFRHHKEQPLPWDVVIVDEASMVDLALMSKLVDALKPGARLILLGDRDQLASVESGSVLADCIEALPASVVELKKSWRFNETISRLASLINAGEPAYVWDMLAGGEDGAVSLASADWLDQAGEKYAHYLAGVEKSRGAADVPMLLELFNGYRILCAVRHGPHGVTGINEAVQRYLSQNGFPGVRQPWYAGRPVLVTQNDYGLGLYNGDIGICLTDADGGQPAVWFERQDGSYRSFSPVRLPACETAFAMTVHKSQGSEFAEILVVLPQQDSQVLSRELLYTAVTRARERVVVLAEKAVCEAAVGRRIERHSGLTERCAGKTI